VGVAVEDYECLCGDAVVCMKRRYAGEMVRMKLKESKLASVFFCDVCQCLRSLGHDCGNFTFVNNGTSSHKAQLKSKRVEPNYDAWIGDAELCLDVRKRLGKVSEEAERELCSNKSLAAYIKSYNPEVCQNITNGHSLSDHTLGTIFEAMYHLKPEFREKYLNRKFPALAPNVVIKHNLPYKQYSCSL